MIDSTPVVICRGGIHRSSACQGATEAFKMQDLAELSWRLIRMRRSAKSRHGLSKSECPEKVDHHPSTEYARRGALVRAYLRNGDARGDDLLRKMLTQGPAKNGYSNKIRSGDRGGKFPRRLRKERLEGGLAAMMEPIAAVALIQGRFTLSWPN